MSKDRQVISTLTPAELVALMHASGVVAVHETAVSDGKPVIHASVKVVNAQTGEPLPGGLPFSVVMFKSAGEPACSNIAIGTIVPAAELKVSLPRDYFNFCNQRFRFARTFPLDERSFVIQMDLVVKNATREYVKFGFGLWSALFSQMLFELMGRGRESLIAAAEAYAAARTDFAEQIASSPASVGLDTVMPLEVGTIVVAEAPLAEEPLPEQPAAEEPPEVPAVEDAKPEEPAAVASVGDPAAEELPDAPVEEPAAAEPVAEESPEEPVVEALAAEEPVAGELPEEAAVEEPKPDEPVSEQPVAEEPAADAEAGELTIVAGPKETAPV